MKAGKLEEAKIKAIQEAMIEAQGDKASACIILGASYGWMRKMIFRHAELKEWRIRAVNPAKTIDPLKAVNPKEKKARNRIDKMKVRLVHIAMKRHHGNKTRAAEDLGLSLRGIRHIVQGYEELREWRRPSRPQKRRRENDDRDE